MVGVAQTLGKKALGAPEAREKWCQCVSEFGEMVSQEVKTNPRYKQLQLSPGKEEPPR